MLRKLTPFLMLSVSFIIYGIYIVIKESNLGWGWFAVFGFVILSLILFAIDFGLKKWLKNYKRIFFTELLITLLIVFIYNYQFSRKKTLIIPSDFDKEYVTIIYGVENTEELSISVFTWNKEIEIPQNGILLTSSNFNENLRETDIKMKSGVYLNSGQPTKGFIRLTESSFDLNGQVYKFRTWKIQDEPCCMYTTEEVEKYKEQLKTKFEKLTASSQQHQ